MNVLGHDNRCVHSELAAVVVEAVLKHDAAGRLRQRIGRKLAESGEQGATLLLVVGQLTTIIVGV